MIARVTLCSLVLAAALAQAVPVHAAPTSVHIPAGPLAQALSELTRQTGAELLYDQRIVQGTRSANVRGSMSAEQALARLLAGTGLGFRRTREGVLVLFVAGQAPAQAAVEPPVPEILVIGRRTQNADIRRTQNDIQPYVVTTQRDIENAHFDNVGSFFRARITAEASPTSLAQDTVADPGWVNSVINLRGLGSVRTLVLVDGRRMPSRPTSEFDFGQADLNAIPTSAIERIETLTGTAGGIYGPGAIGGVVNVVLRRNFRGADIRLVSGISSRGDSKRLGIEGRVGFTPDDGRTDVMILASRTIAEPLLQGQRDYAERAARIRYENNPAGYLARPTLSEAIGVFSQNGNLTFDPQFGGGDLGSPVTFLPIGFSGSPEERAAALRANAGEIVFAPPRNRRGSENYLLARPTVTSGMLNVRHAFSDRLQGFIDLLYFRDDGRFEGSLQTTVVTGANAPNNPFQQPVRFTFPGIGFRKDVRTRLDSRRASLGLIADLGSWKGSADLTLGRAKTRFSDHGSFSGLDFLVSLISGTPGEDGQPLVDPLGDSKRLEAVMDALAERSTSGARQENHSAVAAVRLAGPLASLAGGPLNLTLLAERRGEHTPEGHFQQEGSDGFEYAFPVRRQAITSAYGELRAPLLPHDSGGLLRGLELQLAARYDRVRTTLPENATPTLPTNDDLVSIVNDGLTFTAGARVFPLPALMLRASIATGQLPPTIRQLSTDQRTFDSDSPLGIPDPRRGSRPLGSEGPLVVSFGGSHDLDAERARTLSIGAILNPDGGRLPRLSLDFTRVDVRHEVVFLSANLANVLANEDQFAGRIVRGPLTETDRVAGFTAGPIASIDLGAFNGGRTKVETVDAQLDWTTSAGSEGSWRFYGSVTWYPTFSIKRGATAPWLNRLQYIDGPLRWRGNIGVEWTKGSLMVGINARRFYAYAPTNLDDVLGSNSLIVANQGSNRIPPQTYVDLTVRRHFAMRGAGMLKTFDVNFGVLNLLDRDPPVITQNLLPGYSFYGDPRGRRFELVLSSAF